jgi:hypothetical protein
MSTPRAHTIKLIGDGRYEEGIAGPGVTLPGHLIAPRADGTYLPHTTAGAKTGSLFACEDSFQGKTINDAYASGDLIQIYVAEEGDVINAWLPVGQNVTPASYLTSNGDGTLKVASGGDIKMFQPLESINLTGSGASNSRIRVRVL